jgi:hypothetical protein
MTRLIAVAAATLAISAGAAMAETDGYVYPGPLPRWMPLPSSAGSSSVPTKQDLETTGNTGIYESHAAASPGIWLFPPNRFGGGND